MAAESSKGEGKYEEDDDEEEEEEEEEEEGDDKADARASTTMTAGRLRPRKEVESEDGDEGPRRR